MSGAAVPSSCAQSLLPAAGAVALTVTLWASSFPAIRVALGAFSPGELAALRYLIASAALALYVVLRRPGWPMRGDLPRIGLTGVLGIAAYNLLLNTGELTVDAGTASFIVNTVPVFTAVFGLVFLYERFRAWGWIGMALSFAGVAVIAGSAWRTAFRGWRSLDPRCRRVPGRAVRPAKAPARPLRCAAGDGMGDLGRDPPAPAVCTLGCRRERLCQRFGSGCAGVPRTWAGGGCLRGVVIRPVAHAGEPGCQLSLPGSAGRNPCRLPLAWRAAHPASHAWRRTRASRGSAGAHSRALRGNSIAFKGQCYKGAHMTRVWSAASGSWTALGTRGHNPAG